MSEELVALLISLAIATIPNLIIKIVDKKPREDLNKATLEAADISFDMLKETLSACKNDLDILKENNIALTELSEVRKHDNELLRAQIKSLEEELKDFKEKFVEKIDEIGDKDALRN